MIFLRFCFLVITLSISGSFALEWECKYFFNEEFGYTTCLVGNVTLEKQPESLTFTGTQEQKEWVELIQIRQSNTSIVPNKVFDTFANMIILEIMNVSLRNINQDSFKNGKALNRFWARDNLIQTIPNHTFIEAHGTTHIGLQNNLIETVEPLAFIGLDHLKVLKLEFNKIKSLPDEVFWPLINLDHLHCRDNQLKKISEKLLKKNIQLNFVNFQNNIISYIHNHAFDESVKLNHLILLNNVCIDKDLNDIRSGQLRKLKHELQKCFKLH